MSNPSILVVDDEINNFSVIKIFLANEGYELHYQSNAEDAIANIHVYQPDVILLDVMMPDIDGIELCIRLKAMQQWAHVPIIMVTSLTSKKDLALCLKAGATDFISKPVDRIELQARVKSMLSIKKQYDQIKTLSNLQENMIHLLQTNLSELCGNLSSVLPHELSTPLNGVLGAIGILRDDHQNMQKEEIDEWLTIGQESLMRLEKLTKKFLQYARVEMCSVNPNEDDSELCNPYELKIPTEFLTAVTLKSKADIAGRTDDLVMNMEDVEISMIERDYLLIVNELADNAFKFSKAGTSVVVSSQLKDGMFHLSITDHGRGMTEAQIAKVGAFLQFDRKKHEQQGMGLGLQIVKRLVEIHGGKFSISSIYNQETTFHLELPL